MEYHLGGCRKTYLLLRVTSHFSRESTSQASGTDIFISKTRLRHALCMRKQGKAVVMVGMPDASAALSGRKGLKIYTY